MRASLALSATVSLLALSSFASPAFAQTTPTTPPGVPESSTQDDDPSAAPAADADVSATASEVATPEQTGSGDNTIVVTGSRIARPEFSFPNPIQAYTSESIQQAGTTNLTDFLLDSPALRGSVDNQDVAGSALTNATYTGLNLLDLRNLGEERTLVLVNGRRHIAGYPGLASVDINTIPIELIDRVDILTGGTSAVYGSDGVSGVVNFVLKRNFEGFTVRAQAGISQRGDAGNRYISGVWGQNFAGNRGNVAVAYEFNEVDRFSQTKRLNYGKSGPSTRIVRNPADTATPGGDDPNIPDYVPLTDLRWLDSSRGGAIDLDQDFVPDFEGEGGIYDGGTIVPGSSFTIGGSSTPQDIYFGDFTPGSRRHIANAIGSFEFSPALRVFGEAKYVRARADTVSQPIYDFFTFLEADNAYLNNRFGTQIAANPDYQFGAYVTGRDHFDFGQRDYVAKRDTYRTVAGVDGKFSDNLRYELTYTFGRVDSAATSHNDRYTDRYFAALDAVVNPANGQVTCRINLPGETEIRAFGVQPEYFGGTLAPSTFSPGQCVPLNILGEGSPSQEALDFILTSHTDKSRISHHVVSGYVAGDTGKFFNLQGGPIGFAAGAEYRKEKSRYVPDELSRQGLLADYSTTAIETGSFNVKEAFAEINVPIFKDLPFAQTLAVGGAIRASDYSTIGSARSWNGNAVYSPVRDITFRGTYSQAVRAPNVTELFAGESGGFFFITDPCGIDQVNNGTSTRAANCAAGLTAIGIDPTTFNPANDPTSPQGSSIQGTTAGNRDLDGETAKTWTAGVVLRPRFIPGLNIAADWYDIKIKEAVNQPTATELVQLCYDNPTLDNIYCSLIERDLGTGYITDFTIRPENVAGFDVEGLDLTLNYRFRPFSNAGTFNLKLVGNYLKKIQFIPTPGAEVDDDLEEPNNPKYSGTADLTWTKGPLTLNYGVNYFSRTWRSVERVLVNDVLEGDPDYVEKKYRKYKAFWNHQAQVAYDINDRMNLYLGADNLLDTKPDVGASGYPNTAVGRFFYAGARLKLR